MKLAMVLEKENIILTGSDLNFEQIKIFLNQKIKSTIQIAPSQKKIIKKTRVLLEKLIQEDKPHYGINTGFGFLAERIRSRKVAT